MKIRSLLGLVVAAVGTVAATASHASIIWTWEVSGSGLVAAGTLTTESNQTNGQYLVTSMASSTPGLSLLAPGSLGGNDNLLAIASPQLTLNGIAFGLGGAQDVNVYFDTASNMTRACGSLWAGGCGNANSTDPVVMFSATQAVPEPASFGLAGLALLMAGAVRVSQRKAAQG